MSTQSVLPQEWATANSDQRSTMMMQIVCSTRDEIKEFRSKVDTLIPLVNILNARCKKLESEVDELKMILSCNSQAAELKISGIPLSVTLPETIIAQRVLTNLKLDSLHNSILSVRKVNYKDTPQSQAIIVQFASCQIRDFVVQTVKRRGGIFCDEIFPEFVESHVKIYANEFFSQATHTLLQKTKEKAKVCNYKFTWARNGVIYTRKDESSKTIPIITENDLDKMRQSD